MGRDGATGVAELSRYRRIGECSSGECGLTITFRIATGVDSFYKVGGHIAFGVIDRKGDDKQRTGNGQ